VSALFLTVLVIVLQERKAKKDAADKPAKGKAASKAFLETLLAP
jgi:hypothetical protein